MGESLAGSATSDISTESIPTTLDCASHMYVPYSVNASTSFMSGI